MKPLISICFLIALCMSGQVLAQSEAPRYRDMVIEIQGLDEGKRLPALKQQLQQGGQVIRVEAFCADQGWLLLRITEDAITGDEQVEQLLKPMGLSFLIKTGATRKEFNEACKSTITQF